MALSTITKICMLTSWTSWIRTSIRGLVGIPRMAINLPRQQERSLNVLQQAIRRLHKCGDHMACQKGRSIGRESATINLRALSGDQMARQKRTSFGVSKVAANWSVRSGDELAARVRQSIEFCVHG